MLRHVIVGCVVLTGVQGVAWAQPGTAPPPAPMPMPVPGPLPESDAERAFDAADAVLAVAAEHFDEARQLRDALGLARELAYADPQEVSWALASAYGEILADPIMGPLLTNLVAQYRGGFGRVTADAGAGADVELPASMSASVSASYELPLCRVVGARAAGLGGWDRDEGGLLSYVLTGSACLPLPFDTLEFAYTRRGNVRTSLTAGPVVLENRRTGDIYDIDLRFYRYSGPANHVDVMPMRIHIDVSRDDAGGFGAIWSDVDGAMTIWRRRGKGIGGDDQKLTFLRFHLSFQDDDAAVGGRNAGVFTLWPLVMEGLHVTPDVAASVGGGWVTAGGEQGDARVVEDVGAAAFLQLETVRGPVRASVRAAREYVPTFDAQFVVDDRVTTQVDVSTRHVAAALAVFAARDLVRRDTGTVDPELVTGGSLDAAYGLGRGFQLLGRVEGSHAIVAGRAMDDVTTNFEVRASGGVSWHWEDRWPRRASGVRSGP